MAKIDGGIEGSVLSASTTSASGGFVDAIVATLLRRNRGVRSVEVGVVERKLARGQKN